VKQERCLGDSFNKKIQFGRLDPYSICRAKRWPSGRREGLIGHLLFHGARSCNVRMRARGKSTNRIIKAERCNSWRHTNFRLTWPTTRSGIFHGASFDSKWDESARDGWPPSAEEKVSPWCSCHSMGAFRVKAVTVVRKTHHPCRPVPPCPNWPLSSVFRDDLAHSKNRKKKTADRKSSFSRKSRRRHGERCWESGRGNPPIRFGVRRRRRCPGATMWQN